MYQKLPKPCIQSHPARVPAHRLGGSVEGLVAAGLCNPRSMVDFDVWEGCLERA